MQVSLEPVDWEKLTSFGSSREYLTWYDSLDDPQIEAPTFCCAEWKADGFSQYWEAAKILDHALRLVNEEQYKHLSSGLCRLINLDEKVDDFSMRVISEGWCWLSASPVSTKEILGYSQKVNIQEICDLTRKNRIEELDEYLDKLEQRFIPYIGQHLAVLEVAVKNKFGVLGFRG